MKTVVCYGDTNTWGYDEETGGRLDYDSRWTGILDKELGDGWRVVEEGLPGRTTVNEDPVEQHKNGREQLYPCLESHGPIDVMVLMLGQVELKSRFSLTAWDIAMGMEELVRIVKESGAGPDGGAPAILLISPVLVGTVKGTPMEKWFPAEGTAERSALFPSLYREIAARHGAVFLEASSVAETAADAIHIANGSQRAFALAVAKRVRELEGGSYEN